MDIASLVAAGMPQWLIAAAVIIGFVGTVSEKAGKLAGPLGAPSRWWHARQERADRELDDLVEAKIAARLPVVVEEAMVRERAWMDEERRRSHAAYERLKHDYERVRREVDELREARRRDSAYIQRVTAWADAQSRHPGWSALPPPEFPRLPGEVAYWARSDCSGDDDE